MDGAGIESLNIPEDKKNYILNKVSPILEELVTDVISSQPPNPAEFMVNWLLEKKDVKLTSGNNSTIAALEKQIAELKKGHGETIAYIAEQVLGPDVDKAEDESEEEDDDDELDDSAFEQQVNKRPRTSVSAEAYGEWNKKGKFTPKVIPKSEDQKKRIRETLGACFMFTNLAETDLCVVVDSLEERILEAGTRVIEQGDDGDFCFVIEDGTLECFKKQDDGSEKMVKAVKAGDIFGELSLLYNVPRAASVVAKDKCILWQLDREVFNHIVKDSAAKKREMHDSFLQKVPLLKAMQAYERSQIADALKIQEFAAGQTVIEQGDIGNQFYILESGTAEAWKDGAKVKEYAEGEYFGELALIKDEPRAATVKTTSNCSILSLDRKSFNRLLGPLKDLMSNVHYN